MTKLVLASANPDKLQELRYLLRGLKLTVVPARDLLPGWTVEETGRTLEANAYIKARDVFLRTGLPSVADDTGLFVDVLGGAPGIFAARFAGIQCTYESNLKKLLTTMLCETNRRACFRTTAVLVSTGTEFSVTGEVSGIILDEPDGTGGFGYDPIFLPDGLDHSFARCTPEEKNSVSHRSRAMRDLRKRLLGTDLLT